MKNNIERIIEIDIDDEKLKKYNKLVTDKDKLEFFLLNAKEQGKIKDYGC